MNRFNEGEVTFKLGERELTLKCYLGAGQNVSRRFGGFRSAPTFIEQLDLDAITFIIAQGAATPEKDMKALAEEVFANGLPDLIKPVSDYVYMLAAGGKAPPDPDAKGNDPLASG